MARNHVARMYWSALWAVLALAVHAGFASARNLVPNSSFELGNVKSYQYLNPDLMKVNNLCDRRWGSPHFMYTDEELAKLRDPSKREAFHGRMVGGVMSWPVKYCSESMFFSAPFYVPSGKQYVFSFYMKSDSPGQVTCRLGANPENSTDRRYPLTLNVTPTNEWRRYSVSGVVEGGVDDFYYIEFQTSSPILVDAVQLEEGSEATQYAPMDPLEFGIAADPDLNVFEAGKPVKVRIQTYNREPSMSLVKLDLIAKDFRDRQILKKSLSVEAPSGFSETEVSLLIKTQGSVRLELYEAAGSVVDELAIAVLPVVPVQDRGVGGQYAHESVCHTAYPKYLGLRYVGGDPGQWERIQPDSPDQWNWDAADEQVNYYLAQGVKFKAAYLWGWPIPKWAQEKANKRRPWPRWVVEGKPLSVNTYEACFDLDDFEKYVYETVKHFKGRIDSWVVWNEPYYYEADGYFELMKAVYPVIKRANPEAEVCGADPPPVTSGWMDRFIELGGLKHLDVLTSHAYSHIGGYLPKSVAILKKWATSDGVNRKVYTSETTLYPWYVYTFYTHVRPSNIGVSGDSEGHTAEEGASRWAKMMITQHAAGVDVLMPHYMLLANPGFTPGMLMRGSLGYDGTWAPYASAWAVAGRMIATAKGRGQVQGSPDLRIMMFNKRGKSIAAVWTREHEQIQFSNPIRQGLFRTRADAKKNRGVYRKIVVPKQHDMRLGLDPGKFDAFDIMGNRVKLAVRGGKTIIPVSSDPVYIIGKGIPEPQLRKALSEAQISGFGSFDLAADFASSIQGVPGIVAKLASKSGRRQNVDVQLVTTPRAASTTCRAQKVVLSPDATKEAVFPMNDPPAALSGFEVTAKAASEQRKIAVDNLRIVSVKKLSAPPNMNERLDEWASIDPVELRQEGQASDSKLSAKARFGWDEENLYLAVEVLDKSQLNPAPFPTLASDYYDSVALSLDADVLSDDKTSNPGGTVRNINFSPGPSGQTGGDVIWYCRATMQGVTGHWSKTETGYNVVAAVPWANLIACGASGQSGSVLGFSVSVNSTGAKRSISTQGRGRLLLAND